MTDDDRQLVLQRVMDAFNQHDVETIAAHLADDCVMESPRGTDIWGTRLQGRDRMCALFAERFAAIPDVSYTDDTHFVSGDRGLSEFTTAGTNPDGTTFRQRACDVWTFDADGKLSRKDSFWKIVDPA
jgi:ketosteroid isomerase-like protein